MRALAALVLAAVAGASAGGARASAWEHPDFASAASRPRRIAVLPAQSSMTRTRLNDAVPFVKETALLETALRNEAAGSLRALGYEPDLAALSPEALARDRELRELVRSLETQLGGVVDVAAGRPRDIARGRYSVGDAVLPLQARTQADGFLWVESQSVVPSKGQRTLASIFTVLSGSVGVPTNQTQVLVVLVDAHTGNLASVASAVTGGAVLKEPEQVAQRAVSQVFRQWPSFAAARRVSPKRQAAAEAAVAPRVPGLAGAGPLDEAEVIARFEEAAARASGEPAPERVAVHDEFTDDGRPIAAADAPDAAPISAFEPAGARPPTSATATIGSTDTIVAPPPAAAWQSPPAAASRQFVLQMLDGGPGVVVRSMVPEDVLVSVDLGAWSRLRQGEQVRVETGPGSHRILALSVDGRELARTSVLVSDSLATAELWGL